MAPVGHSQGELLTKKRLHLPNWEAAAALQPLGSEVKVELLLLRGAQGCGAGGLIVSKVIPLILPQAWMGVEWAELFSLTWPLAFLR